MDTDVLFKVVTGERRGTHDIQSIAQEVYEYLRQEGAIRLDEETIGAFFTVRDLADELDFFVSDWTLIKVELLQMGIPICYKPGKGHYIGAEGEEIANVFYCSRMVSGWEARARAYAKAAGRHNTAAQRALIESRWGGKGASYDEIMNRFGKLGKRGQS